MKRERFKNFVPKNLLSACFSFRFARITFVALGTVGVHPAGQFGIQGFGFSHGFNCFRPSLRHESDRTAFITEGRAHFVGQIFFVGVGKKLVAVDEQQERRR